MSEKPSVIIAAKNEEAYIARTLHSLDNRYVARPTVIINGSEDATAQIAIDAGADVHILDEANKHAALKYGIEQLRPEKRLAPILFMDADAYPESTEHWAGLLVAKLLESGRPAAAAVPIGFCDGWGLRDTRRTRKWDEALPEHVDSGWPRFSGQAMGICLKNDRLFKAIMNMPLIWPGEDYAIAKVIKNHGGTVAQITDPAARVMTSSRRFLSPVKRFTRGNTWVDQQLFQSYLDEAPVGTRPYRPGSRRGY